MRRLSALVLSAALAGTALATFATSASAYDIDAKCAGVRNVQAGPGGVSVGQVWLSSVEECLHP